MGKGERGGRERNAHQQENGCYTSCLRRILARYYWIWKKHITIYFNKTVSQRRKEREGKLKKNMLDLLKKQPWSTLNCIFLSTLTCLCWGVTPNLLHGREVCNGSENWRQIYGQQAQRHREPLQGRHKLAHITHTEFLNKPFLLDIIYNMIFTQNQWHKLLEAY